METDPDGNSPVKEIEDMQKHVQAIMNREAKTIEAEAKRFQQTLSSHKTFRKQMKHYKQKETPVKSYSTNYNKTQSIKETIHPNVSHVLSLMKENELMVQAKSIVSNKDVMYGRIKNVFNVQPTVGRQTMEKNHKTNVTQQRNKALKPDGLYGEMSSVFPDQDMVKRCERIYSTDSSQATVIGYTEDDEAWDSASSVSNMAATTVMPVSQISRHENTCGSEDASFGVSNDMNSNFSQDINTSSSHELTSEDATSGTTTMLSNPPILNIVPIDDSGFPDYLNDPQNLISVPNFIESNCAQELSELKQRIKQTKRSVASIVNNEGSCTSVSETKQPGLRIKKQRRRSSNNTEDKREYVTTIIKPRGRPSLSPVRNGGTEGLSLIRNIISKVKQDIESEKQKGKYIFEQRLKHRSSLTYGYDLQRARSYSRQQDFNIKLEAITTKENKGVESEPTKCITQGEGGMEEKPRKRSNIKSSEVIELSDDNVDNDSIPFRPSSTKTESNNPKLKRVDWLTSDTDLQDSPQNGVIPPIAYIPTTNAATVVEPNEQDSFIQQQRNILPAILSLNNADASSPSNSSNKPQSKNTALEIGEVNLNGLPSSQLSEIGSELQSSAEISSAGINDEECATIVNKKQSVVSKEIEKLDQSNKSMENNNTTDCISEMIDYDLNHKTIKNNDSKPSTCLSRITTNAHILLHDIVKCSQKGNCDQTNSKKKLIQNKIKKKVCFIETNSEIDEDWDESDWDLSLADQLDGTTDVIDKVTLNTASTSKPFVANDGPSNSIVNQHQNSNSTTIGSTSSNLDVNVALFSALSGEDNKDEESEDIASTESDNEVEDHYSDDNAISSDLGEDEEEEIKGNPNSVYLPNKIAVPQKLYVSNKQGVVHELKESLFKADDHFKERCVVQDSNLLVSSRQHIDGNVEIIKYSSVPADLLSINPGRLRQTNSIAFKPNSSLELSGDKDKVGYKSVFPVIRNPKEFELRNTANDNNPKAARKSSSTRRLHTIKTKSYKGSFAKILKKYKQSNQQKKKKLSLKTKLEIQQRSKAVAAEIYSLTQSQLYNHKKPWITKASTSESVGDNRGAAEDVDVSRDVGISSEVRRDCLGRIITHYCRLCKKKFNNRHQVDSHMLIKHSLDQKYKCTECSLTFPFRRLMMAHVKNTHTVKSPQPEGVYGHVWVYPGHLVQPQQEHIIAYDYNQAEPVLKCCLCTKHVHSYDMTLHYRRFHPTWRLKYICSSCGTVFKAFRSLVRHTKREKGCSKLYCTQCNLHVSTMEEFLQHNATDHPVETAIKKALQCHKCGNVFTQRWYLQNHLASCKKEKELAHDCGLCGRSFVSIRGLQTHLLKTHSTDDSRQRVKPYFCNECNLPFITRNDKERHNSQFHRNHKCEECGKGFINESKLKRHQIQHRTEKTFSCPVCDTSNRYRSDICVRKHMRRCHPEKFVEYYGWDVKVVKYMCEVCEKTCPTRGDLQKHMRKHTNERPYTCEHCTSAFKQRRHLKEHMMYKHKEAYEVLYGTIVYKHNCDECDSKFLACCALKKHKRSHVRQRMLEEMKEQKELQKLAAMSTPFSSSSSSKRKQRTPRKKAGEIEGESIMEIEQEENNISMNKKSINNVVNHLLAKSVVNKDKKNAESPFNSDAALALLERGNYSPSGSNGTGTSNLTYETVRFGPSQNGPAGIEQVGGPMSSFQCERFHVAIKDGKVVVQDGNLLQNNLPETSSNLPNLGMGNDDQIKTENTDEMEEYLSAASSQNGKGSYIGEPLNQVGFDSTALMNKVKHEPT